MTVFSEEPIPGRVPVRRFTDDEQRDWVATVAAEEGGDYKGRYYLVLHPADDADTASRVALDDVRWNSRRTAERTLRTMSMVELRRRLRSAEGRARRAPAMAAATP